MYLFSIGFQRVSPCLVLTYTRQLVSLRAYYAMQTVLTQRMALPGHVCGRGGVRGRPAVSEGGRVDLAVGRGVLRSCAQPLPHTLSLRRIRAVYPPHRRIARVCAVRAQDLSVDRAQDSERGAEFHGGVADGHEFRGGGGENRQWYRGRGRGRNRVLCT